MCVCVCVYIYTIIHIHKYTHTSAYLYVVYQFLDVSGRVSELKNRCALTIVGTVKVHNGM